MDLGAGLLPADDEVLVAEFVPANAELTYQAVLRRQDHKHPFAPELLRVAVGNGRHAGDEGDVETTLAHPRDMCVGRTFSNINVHPVVLPSKGTDRQPRKQ
jgi:hypothetical protein